MAANPIYDVVVFGATSFVGQILSEYLVKQYGVDGELSWAIAGRSEAKLRTLRTTLGKDAASLSLIRRT